MINKVYTVLFISFFFKSFVWAQYAKVIDTGTTINLRKEPSIHSDILMQIPKNEIIYFLPTNEPINKWYPITYKINEKNIQEGFIYESRLRFLNNYPAFTKKKISDKEWSFVYNNMQINIQITDFDYAANKKDFINNFYKGKAIFGIKENADKIRLQQYFNIIIKIGKHSFRIPKKELENLFQPNANATNIYYDESTNRIYITVVNGDAESSYDLIFIIENGKYKSKHIHTNL